MNTPFRRFLLLSCACLLAGLSGCGVFKDGDCDCPAFSQNQEPSSEQTLAPVDEAYAVNSPSESTGK